MATPPACWHLPRASRLAAIAALRFIQGLLGSALNLKIHFHMLFLDGVYTENEEGKRYFCRVKAPTREELQSLVHQLSLRIGRYLERQGLIERDMENSVWRQLSWPVGVN